MYFFTTIFTAVYNKEQLILDNLCTKQGNSSIKSAVYNQERVITACVRYSIFMHKCQSEQGKNVAKHIYICRRVIFNRILSGEFSAGQAQSKVVKILIFPTGLEVHLEDMF